MLAYIMVVIIILFPQDISDTDSLVIQGKSLVDEEMRLMVEQIQRSENQWEEVSFLFVVQEDAEEYVECFICAEDDEDIEPKEEYRVRLKN